MYDARSKTSHSQLEKIGITHVPHELEVQSLYHVYSLKARSSQCHNVLMSLKYVMTV